LLNHNSSKPAVNKPRIRGTGNKKGATIFFNKNITTPIQVTGGLAQGSHGREHLLDQRGNGADISPSSAEAAKACDLTLRGSPRWWKPVHQLLASLKA
jgi:hypothetical protein